jgi:hypothetical protein
MTRRLSRILLRLRHNVDLDDSHAQSVEYLQDSGGDVLAALWQNDLLSDRNALRDNAWVQCEDLADAGAVSLG